MIITPTYHFNGDCEEALHLYQKAFDGTITALLRYKDANPQDMSIDHLSDEEKNYLYHSEMTIGPYTFRFSDSLKEVPKGQNVFIAMNYDTPEEVKKAYRILVDGGEVIYPMTKTTYCSCFVSLFDKFGIRWVLMA